MKQGVLTQDRVRLMMRKGEQGCRGYGMRKGEAYRKSVRGCIISHNISVLHLVIVKKGDDEIPGLTDNQIPRRLGPKRASKLRKLFALTKDDDVRKYVIRRELTGKEKEEEAAEQGAEDPAPRDADLAPAQAPPPLAQEEPAAQGEGGGGRLRETRRAAQAGGAREAQREGVAAPLRPLVAGVGGVRPGHGESALRFT